MKKGKLKYVTYAVAAGVAAYVLFFRKSGGDDGSAPSASPNQGPPPTPSGQVGKAIAIRAGELVSSRTTNIVTSRTPGLLYLPVLQTSRNAAGEPVRSFRSPYNAYFMSQMLVENGRYFAGVRRA